MRIFGFGNYKAMDEWNADMRVSIRNADFWLWEPNHADLRKEC